MKCGKWRIDCFFSEPVKEETEGGSMVRCKSFRTFKHEFELQDATDFIQDGMQVREGGRGGS